MVDIGIPVLDFIRCLVGSPLPISVVAQVSKNLGRVRWRRESGSLRICAMGVCLMWKTLPSPGSDLITGWS